MAERSENLAILIGRLGRDADTKFIGNGTAKTTFSVATSRRWKDQQSGEWKEQTDWTNVVLWRSENLGQYLTKGKQVYVKGRIETRSYEKDGQKHYVTEIVADTVNLLGGGERSEQNDAPKQPVSMPRSARQAAPKEHDGGGFGGQPVDDDDVPF